LKWITRTAEVREFEQLDALLEIEEKGGCGHTEPCRKMMRMKGDTISSFHTA